MKMIWVPKKCLESLQVNVIMTPPVKNRNPRSNSSYVPKSSYGSKSSYGPHSSYRSKSSYEHHRANTSVSQGKTKGYEYVQYSSNHYVHNKSSKTFSAYSYAYPNSSYVKRNGLASMPPFSYGASQSDELFATPSDVGGEEKELISYAGSGLQTCLNV